MAMIVHPDPLHPKPKTPKPYQPEMMVLLTMTFPRFGRIPYVRAVLRKSFLQTIHLQALSRTANLWDEKAQTYILT